MQTMMPLSVKRIPHVSDLNAKQMYSEAIKDQIKLTIDPSDFVYSLSPFQSQEGHEQSEEKIQKQLQETLTNPTTQIIKTSGEGDNQVVLIRHGTSVFNLISEQFAKQTGYTFKDREAYFNFQPLLLDTQLHYSGVLQAQSLGKQLASENMKVHTVFISPLRRTLQTCYNIFKDHPQKDNIKFIVFPLVSEIYSKVCDVFNSEETFIDPQLKEFFDFSLIKQTWQIENIQDKELRDKIMSELKYDENGNCTNLELVALKYVDLNFPKSVEKYDSVFQRGLKTKEYIKNYIKENNIPKSQKIFIISHNSYLRNFTATQPDDGKSGVGGLKFANCQAVKYNF